MTGRQLKAALRAGQTVCGTLIVSPSPKWLKYIRQIPLDFVFIDTEHVALDDTTLSWMCMGYRAMDLAPIVRIPSADPARASFVLDAGAAGILVPYVETVETLQTMAGAVHHKPLKGRKLTRALSGEALYGPGLQKALADADADRLLLANIESVPAMENLDALLAVEGLDGIVVGPNDLSYSMEMPNQYDDLAFETAVCDILRRARTAGIAAGVHALGAIDRQIAWARETGMNLLFHSGDIYAFMQGMRQDILAFRQAVQANAPSAASGVGMEI